MSGLTVALYGGKSNPQDSTGATSDSVERQRTQARRNALALVTLATSLVLLPVAGVADPPSVKPATIKVVDAHGKQVGNVVGVYLLTTTVALRVNDQDLLLSVTAADSYPGIPAELGTLLPIQPWYIAVDGSGFGGNALNFESDDCTGAPLMDDFTGRANGDWRPLLQNIVVALPGMTVYVADQSAGPRQVVVRSFIQGGTASAVCGKTLADLSEVPAIPLIDLLTVYTPPFRIVFADTVAAGGGSGITSTIHLPGCTLTIQGGIIVDATSTIPPFTGGTCQ